MVRSKTKCIVLQNEIILELQKAETGKWDSLHQDVPRKEIISRIEQTLEKERENEQIRNKVKKGTYFTLLKKVKQLPMYLCFLLFRRRKRRTQKILEG